MPDTLPAGVTYQPDFFSGEDRKRLFGALLQLQWSRHTINMYGKKIPAPRFYAWLGTPPKKMYGEPIHLTDWTPETKEVLAKVSEATSCQYDSLNINYYRDQADYLGWHIDPEDEGLWKFPIASLSFGSERPFQMRRYTRVEGKRTGQGEVSTLTLQHGSLLVMPAQFQAGWEHRLDKAKTKYGPRINLTFRRMAP